MWAAMGCNKKTVNELSLGQTFNVRMGCNLTTFEELHPTKSKAYKRVKRCKSERTIYSEETNLFEKWAVGWGGGGGEGFKSEG